MKKIFEFKKEKIEVKIKIELKNNKLNNPVFSCTYELYKNNCLECLGCDIDSLQDILKDNQFYTTLQRLANLYHLNDLHAGTQKQEKALIDAGLNEFANKYTACCNYLQSINLYNDNGHEFGRAWLYWNILQDDLDLINNLFK